MVSPFHWFNFFLHGNYRARFISGAIVGAFVAVLGAISGFPALAQSDKQAAEAAASHYLVSFDNEDLTDIYQNQLGPTFKQAVTEKQFVQQGGMVKIQWGGPAEARSLAGSQLFSQLPTGQTGEFYYVRYKAKYPNGAIFQDVYLEKVGATWKVSGFWIFVAPPGGG